MTIRQEYYWPSMDINVHHTVCRCVFCTKYRIDMRKNMNLLKGFSAQDPLESVVMDLVDPLQIQNLDKHLF